MAQFIVRNVDEDVASRLKKRAQHYGVSTEEMHRRILKQALCVDDTDEFKTLLSQIPAAGDDADFERIPQPPRKIDL